MAETRRSPGTFRIAAAVCVALSAACGSSNATPVRNPLAEAPPAASSTIPPVLPASATPGYTAPSANQLEPAAARAAALLAEWLSIPERDLTVLVAEAVAWPSPCLGVDYPGEVCAAVITPGFRVLLRDRPGGMHAVHLDAGSGGARWAGEARAEATVTSVDRSAQRATLAVQGRALELRLVPGTRWLPEVNQAAMGSARVVVGYDPSGSATTPPVAAWIALDPA
jgi:hypothetical protein